MNEHYRLIASAKQVDQHIAAMSQEILQEHESSPLFVALLRGAAPFASKLMSEITRQSPDFHPELDYMMVSTYGRNYHAGEPRIVTDLSPTTEVSGRNVVIVDDVLEKGITAEFVRRHLQSMGARAVQVAVLARKDVERAYPIEPDYFGIDAGDKWLVGMGMDDPNVAHEGYRWLESIWEIKR